MDKGQPKESIPPQFELVDRSLANASLLLLLLLLFPFVSPCFFSFDFFCGSLFFFFFFFFLSSCKLKSVLGMHIVHLNVWISGINVIVVKLETGE